MNNPSKFLCTNLEQKLEKIFNIIILVFERFIYIYVYVCVCVYMCVCVCVCVCMCVFLKKYSPSHKVRVI